MLKLKLEECYEEKGVTQQQVSRDTRIRESTLSGLRRNVRESWDVDLIERLLIYFEIKDIRDFIEYQPPEDFQTYIDEYNAKRDKLVKQYGKK